MITEERIAKLTSAVYKVTDLFPEKEPLKFVIRRESLDVLSSYVVLVSKSAFEQREKSVKKAISSLKVLINYFDLAELQNWIDSKNFSILKKEYSDLSFWFEERFLNIEMEVKKVLIKNDYVEDIVSDLQVKSDVRIGQVPLEERGNEVVLVSPLEGSDKVKIESEKVKGKEAKVKKPEKAFVDVLQQDGGKKEKDMNMIKSDVVIDYEELSSIQLKTLEILQNKGFLKASQISQHFEDASERSIRREIKELKDKNIIVSKGGGKSTFYELNHVY
ncbi:MAG: HTH domain-containing protein [Candidatus Paceibacterota bacterium]